MNCNRHPILCIIPPYMLQEIAAKGTPEQRQKANTTLQTTSLFRVQREQVKPEEVVILTRVEQRAVKQRNIYDAKYGSTLPGTLVRCEGDPPTADPAVDEAYEGSGATYDLYMDEYQRNSIDGKGMGLDSTVHYQQGYDNAFWNGKQMVYGDGDEDLPLDERLFNRFTVAIDIIGHELTHGVSQHEANFTYSYQPGALSESFSDVFGSLVKQRRLGQTAAQADWVIGEGLFTPNINGYGIRSMKAPGTAYDDPVLGKDPQPAHMKDYKNITYDNGGVHINSGIPNHAFYVAAIEIGGYAWEKAGRIWYVTLRDRLGILSTFQEAAQSTFRVAAELYGVNSLEQQAVRKGWSAVGIEIDPQAPSDNPGCLPALLNLIRPFSGRFK